MTAKAGPPPVAVTLLVALPAEAKPLRHSLGLVRDNRFTALPLYRRGSLALAITGSGPEAAQAGVARLTRQLPETQSWINCGIAGHPALPLGTPVTIDRLRCSGEAHYTDLETLGEGLVRQPLITHPEPTFDYGAPACVDMEAAYLYAALQEHTPEPHFYCLKVISDNTQSRGTRINGRAVSSWMASLLSVLEPMINSE
jgi:hypothetical protein